jgi:hypothetical protein
MYFSGIILGLSVISFIVVRYYFFILPREKVRTEELVRQAELSAQQARPLKDYVANIQPRKKSLIPFRIPFLGSSTPSLTNIRRFTALTFSGSSEIFYVKDEQGTIYGPAGETAILTWISEERIKAETMMSNHELGPWIAAKQIRTFRLSFEPMDSPSVKKRFENIQINQ